MKKHAIIATALLALSGLVSLPAAAQVAPDHEEFRFECPHTTGVPSEKLVNYGTYIAGLGESNFSGIKTKPLFKGVVPVGASIPADLALGGYTHNGVTYNPNTGRITCYYKSAIFDSFNVSYVAQNSKGGLVLKTTSSTITVKIGIGAR